MQESNDCRLSVNVKKANAMIDSVGQTSLMGSKVMLAALLRVKKRSGPVGQGEEQYYRYLEDKYNIDYSRGLVASFSNSELREILGKKQSGSYYATIVDLMDPDPSARGSLMNQWRIIVKDKKTKSVGAANLISGTCYDAPNGRMFIKFTAETRIEELIYNLQGDYTSLPYQLMMSMKSVYTFRLFEMLYARMKKEDAVTKKRKEQYIYRFSLSELKYEIGVLNPFANKQVSRLLTEYSPDYDAIEKNLSGEKILQTYTQFRKMVLDKAKAQINDMPDCEIDFDYSPVRQGRGGKVTQVDLIITRRTPLKEDIDDEKLSEDEFFDTVFDLTEGRLRAGEVRTLCKAAEYNLDRIQNAWDVAVSMGDKVENLGGFLVSAVRENYRVPQKKSSKKNASISSKKTKSKNRFNNFTQREYDFEALENALLSDDPVDNVDDIL